MVFSSIFFLYYFLVVTLIVYFLVPKKFKNIVLLLASIFFYFYGEPRYTILLIFSCVFNFFIALGIEKFEKPKWKKILLVSAIVINVGILGYFKYTNFFIENINSIFKTDIKVLKLALPLAISFFTFQTLSYVFDVYMGKIQATRNFLDFSTFICMFPKLTAGPIVRYSQVSEELKERTVTADLFSKGARRLVLGLGKKVLISNVIGEMCSLLGAATPSVFGYILRGIGFTLQLYFDFSGYSDMAIGLGMMFGFKFLENFNYPLIANSATDFWRRWHISLSSWFRDYIYIPLGGNRVKTWKYIRNIFIVWFVTGFWHGASWNFIAWGLFFGIFLTLEKFFYKGFLDKHKVIGHIYTLFLVLISFILFSTNTIGEAGIFIKSMFGLNKLPFINAESLYLFRSYAVVLVMAIVGSTPLLKNLFTKISEKYQDNKKIRIVLSVLEICYVVLLLVLVTAFTIDSSFNPFLYFRF